MGMGVLGRSGGGGASSSPYVGAFAGGYQSDGGAGGGIPYPFHDPGIAPEFGAQYPAAWP